MASGECDWQLQPELQSVQVTHDESEKVCAPFHRGHWNDTPYESLVRIIDRKREYITGIRDPDIEIIARLIKVVTKNRTNEEASKFLKTKDGDDWLRGCLVKKAKAVSSATANTTKAPGNSLAAVAELDSNNSMEKVATELRYINQPTGVSTASLNRLTGTVELPDTVEPGNRDVEQPLLRQRHCRSYSHSREPNDVSLDTHTYRLHPDGPSQEQLNEPIAVCPQTQNLRPFAVSPFLLLDRLILVGVASLSAVLLFVLLIYCVIGIVCMCALLIVPEC